MFQDVSILIPYQLDNGPRDKAFKWIADFYKTNMPKAELCIGESTSTLFSRSQAINDAARKATKSIFLIVDADLIFNPLIVKKSIQLLNKHAWVIPFQTINYLTETSTNTIYADSPQWPISHQIEFERVKKPTKRTPCVGGCNIVTRKNFERVNGFDERFIGWGGEDQAFMSAMNTLCGPYKRTNTDIFHLWHPHVGNKRNPNYKNNSMLRNRYISVSGDTSAMTKLIKERK
ncbi:putative glycosyltransferase involved in capsule biosynthesis [Salibacterium salarium]|uniref:galactosyltransferase-related protein n=1 Tax=Salibacterium salarium TaxID=284579 RepID=UPI0027803C4F|nr:galactosyltransferase-related protein [Salibacterium salarium]MDQ0300700.1 putative glycosyltransferase involved in capsule biosynthesis [Salibacterium salarium]